MTTPRPPAYPIPWRVTRLPGGVCLLRNEGSEPLHAVSTQLFGEGMMTPAIARGSFAPGADIRIRFHGPRVVETAQITVHWHRPDGREYAWTFVL